MAKRGLKSGSKCKRKKCVKNKRGHSPGCPTGQVKRCASYGGSKRKTTKRKATKRKKSRKR